MQELSINNVKAFAETIQEFYHIFFNRYSLLKPLILKALYNDNGSYGLIITENNLVVGKFSIYKSSEGFIVERNIVSTVGLKYTIDKSLMHQLQKNKGYYIKKPSRLLKYMPALIKNLTSSDYGFYDTILKGQKVILRPYHDSDMPYLLKWYNDYDLNKLAGWTSGKTSASKLRYNMTRSFGSDPMNLMIDDFAGKPIGTIQLYDFNEQDKSCKLGIRIGDKDYWSQGYGADAVNTIAEYGFMRLNINRIALRVYEFNSRAARCYEKCGFKHEGVSRKSAFIDGVYYDELMMGLLKSEFLGKS